MRQFILVIGTIAALLGNPFLQASERQLATLQGLTAVVQDGFSSSNVAIRVIAPNASEFSGDKINLQRLIGALRVPLSMECPSAKELTINGEANGRLVYQGTVAEADDWALKDKTELSAMPPASKDYTREQWNSMGKAGRRTELNASAQRLIEADRQNELGRAKFVDVMGEYFQTKYGVGEGKQLASESQQVAIFSKTKAMEEMKITEDDIRNGRVTKEQSNRLHARWDQIGGMVAKSQHPNDPEKAKDVAEVSGALHGYDKRHVDDIIALKNLGLGMQENETSP